MRIFIGLCEIAGYYSNLTSGLRELGYEVTFIGANEHPFEYSKEDCPYFISLHNFARKQRVTTPRKKLVRKAFWALCEKLTFFFLFFWCLARHDVFIFGYGFTFNQRALDLILFKLFKKRVICNLAHGSEARPPYLDGGYINYCSEKHSQIARKTKNIALKLARIEKYADVVIAAPLASHFFSQPFISTYKIGVPVTISKVANTFDTSPERKKTVRILHAPSNPVCKGSNIIRSAIEELRHEGYEINYVEISGRPHSEVLEELDQCDFIIDQLYSDGPLAGFTTEAAWFKKPAIVGGYGWDIVEQYFPPEHLPLSHTCHPNDLKGSVIRMIRDDAYREELGEKAYRFVQKNWNTQKVARRFEILIKNEPIPTNWYIEPQNIYYLHGCGIKESKLQAVLSRFINSQGSDALQLEARPKLKEKILRFVKGV